MVAMEAMELSAALSRSSAQERRLILEALDGSAGMDVLKAVARHLQDESPSVCEAAVDALVRFGGEAAAEAASEALWAEDASHRGYALEALVDLGAGALGTLLRLLGNADRDIRKYAADALGRVGDAAALPALVAALEDEDVNVAATAAEAMGMLALPEAVPALARSVAMGPDWLRVASLSSLGRIGTVEALEAIRAVPREASLPVLLAAVEAAGVAGHADRARAIGFLCSLLEVAEPPAVEAIVQSLGDLLALGRHPDIGRSEHDLIDGAARVALGSPSPRVRSAALTCLGVTGAMIPGGATGLVSAAVRGDPDAGVRLAGLRALAAMGKQDCRDLQALASDPREDPAVRLQALRLMADVAGVESRASEAVMWGIVREGQNPVLRVAALRLILKGRGAAVLPACIEVLAEDGVLEDAAVLGELGSWSEEETLDVAEVGLADARPELRRRLLTSLLPVERAEELGGSERARAILESALGDEDRRVRFHVVRLAVACPRPWAVELLLLATNDPDDKVRRRAEEALGHALALAQYADGSKSCRPSQEDGRSPGGPDPCSS